MLGAILAVAAVLAKPLPTEFRLIEYASPVYCGGMRGHNIAFTFDDGPSPYTAQLVRVLAKFHARATFFDIGSRIAYWPDAVREQMRVGEIGNHTWSHPHLPKLSPKAIRRELEWTQQELALVTGTAPRLFRPPYEEATPAIDRTARSLELLDVRWSADSGDSRPGARRAKIIRTVVADLKPGAIVLLHDPHPTTPGIAAVVLKAARRRGLRPVTVSQLLAGEPPSAVQLRSAGAARCLP
jgi:peptidoglycan/xylan/chitin deacetylase (PgdA/CDA1 family)